jgi:formylglycine-generating enzyme required for sulfatase activity
VDLYRDDLETLRRSAVSGAEERWVFADPQTRRRHDLVAGFVDGLSRFEETIEEIRARRADASTIARRTIGVYRDAWSSTIEAIADEARNPQYRGLRIEPQLGLVPIGQDPDSHLFEFAHLQTGEVPVRDPNTGKLVLTEETGLLFVLIPGGSFYMGADLAPGEQRVPIPADPPDLLKEPRPVGSPSVDPYGGAVEGPAHRVELDAFFLAKYEMTQGQWLRATNENPSHWSPGSDAHAPVTLLHPVENVSWDQCVETLHRFCLVLPTEAQWEFAARAGTNTVWWTGDRKESLRGAINVADQAAARAGADWPEIAEWPDLDDGYVEHAPVGTFLANPFGLHEVHGNVREFVRDVHGSYEHPVRAGDGERLVEESNQRIARGGGFYEGVWEARMARRYRSRGPTWSGGLRPARTISTSGAPSREPTP